MQMKMLSAKVVCCKHLLTLLTNVSVEANIVDHKQSDLGLHCLSEMLLKQTTNHMTFSVIGALRVNPFST